MLHNNLYVLLKYSNFGNDSFTCNLRNAIFIYPRNYYSPPHPYRALSEPWLFNINIHPNSFWISNLNFIFPLCIKVEKHEDWMGPFWTIRVTLIVHSLWHSSSLLRGSIKRSLGRNGRTAFGRFYFWVLWHAFVPSSMK